MYRGLIKAILGGIAALLLIAPGALAATPEDIYKDLADNGRIDGTYTQAELQAFLQSASVQGYGNPLVIVPPAVVTPPSATVTPPAGTPAVAVTPAATPAAPVAGVAGVSKTVKPAARVKPAAQVAGVATPAQAPLTRTASAETLPFTGIELALFALVGGALLLGGLLLRASARQR